MTYTSVWTIAAILGAAPGLRGWPGCGPSCFLPRLAWLVPLSGCTFPVTWMWGPLCSLHLWAEVTPRRLEFTHIKVWKLQSVEEFQETALHLGKDSGREWLETFRVFFWDCCLKGPWASRDDASCACHSEGPTEGSSRLPLFMKGDELGFLTLFLLTKTGHEDWCWRTAYLGTMPRETDRGAPFLSKTFRGDMPTGPAPALPSLPDPTVPTVDLGALGLRTFLDGHKVQGRAA